MARQRKKKTTRKARKAAAPRRRWPGRLWRLFLLVSGIAAGLLIPWVLYLDYQVTSEFEGRKWDLPSRVYARALELYPGALLTALVVLLFLKNMRSTIIIAVAIPVSLLGAIAVMYFLGYTFNTMTMLGLLLLILFVPWPGPARAPEVPRPT